jgi:RecA-family ATPase
LFERLLAAAKAHEAEPVITDTLADIFSGDESDRGQARLFAQSALGHIARATGAASVTLAHPSLAGSANGSTGSGSTAWKGTFRSQLYLELPQLEEGEQHDPDVRVLRRAKANYASRNDTIELKWQAGVFVPLHAPTGLIASIERRTAKRVFLDLLDAVTAENRHVSESSHARNYAPKLFAQRPDREGFRKADFKIAMEALFAEKELTLEWYRAPNRYQYEHIVRTPK